MTKFFFRKNFLVGIDSELFKTYFKMKISTSNFFSLELFYEDIVVFLKWGSLAQKFAHLDISVIVKGAFVYNGLKNS